MFFSFRLKLFVQASSLMSWGREFQAFGADMRKAISPNFSLDRLNKKRPECLVNLSEMSQKFELKSLINCRNTDDFFFLGGG